MFLNINQITNYIMVCDEKCITSIAGALHRNYEMIFSKSWNFNFLQADPRFNNKLGNRIIIRHKENMESLLEKYHGIQLLNEEHNEIDIIDRILFDINKGLPSVVSFSSPFSPWDKEKSELKQKYNTILLVAGFDKENNQIYCLDFHGNCKGFIPIDIFISYYSNYKKVVVKDIEKSIDYKSIAEDIIVAAKKNDDRYNSFDAMRHFADAVLNELDVVHEMQGENDYFYTPFNYNLEIVRRSRALFALTIKYLSLVSGLEQLDTLSKDFEIAFGMWTLITKTLFKACLKQNNDKEFKRLISEKIYNVAGFEENIAQNLTSLLHNNSIKHDKNTDEIFIRNYEKFKFVYVDLFEYYNNKGFKDNSSDKIPADFDNYGKFYLANEFIMNNTLDVYGFKIFFPDIEGVKFDNISCKAQLINIPAGIYKYIIILGSCVNGEHSEYLIINYINGQKKMKIEFTDWYGMECTSYEEEFIAWRGFCWDNIINTKVPAKIYMKVLTLNDDLEIKSIKLPDCSDMHIFSISLGR